MEPAARSGGIGERKQPASRSPVKPVNFSQESKRKRLRCCCKACSLSLSYMTKSKNIQRLQALAENALPGTLSEVMLRCGKKTCGCSTDPNRRHGPHLYLKFRDENGRNTSLYIPRSYAPEVRRAAEAWSKLRESVAELGRQNREALSKRLRQRRKS